MKGENKIAVAVLLVIIAAAGYFISRQVRTTGISGRPEPGVDWVCEECDARFVASPRAGNRICRVCDGVAVRSYVFYDREEDQLIEVYRMKIREGATPGALEDEDYLYRLPGGEWIPGADPAQMESMHERPVSELEEAPPESSYRRDAPPESPFRQ